MRNAMFSHLSTALCIAEAEDAAARQEALSRGLSATQPLTVTRLGQLCALGERMLRTGIRRKQAQARLGQFGMSAD
jgi:hypothetical protein